MQEFYGNVKSETTNFLKLNNECSFLSGQDIGCNSIELVLDMDPESKKDILYVCNKTKTSFTLKSLSDFVNTRLAQELPGCVSTVDGGLSKVELKEQCPKEEKKYCGSF